MSRRRGDLPDGCRGIVRDVFRDVVNFIELVDASFRI
jgi:hypothetical protein